MNDKRRKKLKAASDHLSLAADIISQVRDGEQDSFDNLPEGLQMSERGEKMEDTVNVLDEIIDDIESVKTELEEVIS